MTSGGVAHMARTNLNAVRIKPEVSELLTLRVLRSERISPHFQRVTLGEGDLERFRPMGYDQWFRLFIPVSGDSLTRLPAKLNTLSYLRFLTISKSSRPVLRNYSVRAYRPEPAEMDVDFVIHGSPGDGTSGPAATWAQDCGPGDPVAILDEGIGFHPAAAPERVRLVADESALPAAAAVLGSLPRHITGHAVIEVPHADDAQPLAAPDGVEVSWVSRDGSHATPGVAALATARALPAPAEPFYGWVAGEQALASGMRRTWVEAGVPKDDIMFCGYWRARG
ncbi:siderophore-interacting protein [Phytohabitans sp. ZYX-F-186]|uniref:Siderophore-interacting protein n=1 Tax=Phytohabitans maris TaxID=3071409 RepID=A0ABU0ZD09_9ACTN|nr:siderophore-interacting protein [Phytohabitans sp. ZYX-F-186]MDQ7904946.1 siderophore-interacting protein [Phytohabitans sp. ZYX-F-186]